MLDFNTCLGQSSLTNSTNILSLMFYSKMTSSFVDKNPEIFSSRTKRDCNALDSPRDMVINNFSCHFIYQEVQKCENQRHM